MYGVGDDAKMVAGLRGLDNKRYCTKIREEKPKQANCKKKKRIASDDGNTKSKLSKDL